MCIRDSFHGFSDGASGVLAVATVRKPAFMGQFREVRKTFPERVFVRPHLDFPDARIVDQQAAMLEKYQFPRHRGMASFAGDFIHFPRPEPFVPQQEMCIRDSRQRPEKPVFDGGQGGE